MLPTRHELFHSSKQNVIDENLEKLIHKKDNVNGLITELLDDQIYQNPEAPSFYKGQKNKLETDLGELQKAVGEIVTLNDLQKNLEQRISNFRSAIGAPNSQNDLVKAKSNMKKLREVLNRAITMVQKEFDRLYSVFKNREGYFHVLNWKSRPSVKPREYGTFGLEYASKIIGETEELPIFGNENRPSSHTPPVTAYQPPDPSNYRPGPSPVYSSVPQPDPHPHPYPHPYPHAHVLPPQPNPGAPAFPPAFPQGICEIDE